MSCAKIGSSAVADEKNVAKKSSSIVERMSGDENTKPQPFEHGAHADVARCRAASRDGTSRIISSATITQTNDSALSDVDPADAERRDHEAAERRAGDRRASGT